MNRLTPGSPSPATLHTNLASNDLSTSAHSWEYLRKQARQLENELEQKLTSYSKIAAQVGRVGYEPGSKEGEGITGNSSEAMELELEELIKKVISLNLSLIYLFNSNSFTTYIFFSLPLL
jgi:golgi SNAP receptor complex member 1